MKNLSIIIAALLFSFLFYKQSIGLNLTLFSILTLVILKLNNSDSFNKKKTLIYSIVYIITAAAVFYHTSIISIIANCLSFFTIIGSISESKSSIYINWLNGIYSSVGGYFHRALEVSKDKKKANIDYIHWLKIIGIPLSIIILFIVLYQNGNPVFSDIISEINFKFINFQWFLFSVLGYFLFNNLVHPVKINPATENDLETKNTLIKGEINSQKKLQNENQLGTILMSSLNVLIVFFLVTDLIYLISTKDLNAVQLSNQLHSGINALIASIVIAIVIILYFFRGNLNFYQANGTLKKITYLWISLNIFLVAIIAIKNYQYIHAFGFTYKRIGVFFYLLLTLIGLITTVIKVLKIKNIWFLVRINLQTTFAFLIVSSLLNWDVLISNYNIKHAHFTDVEYLIKLSDKNSKLLKSYSKSNTLSEENNKQIALKYDNYINKLNKLNWQELNYEAISTK